MIDAYHCLHIQKGNEWKTIFCYQYGHFEYQVVPFRLVNVPAAFQTYVNQTLREYIGIFVLAYLDNIMVFSKQYENHIEHIQMILQKL